ncbi:MAG: hypothetical protein Q7U99_04900 [Rubrivivax sp.]|nr:hypothetical protein [Rubrivivax sp.]
MLALVLTFEVSPGVTLMVIHSSKTHGRFSLDHDLSGPQRFRAHAVSRVGGIVAGLGCAIPALWLLQTSAAKMMVALLLCGLPAFGAGLVEDAWWKTSPSASALTTVYWRRRCRRRCWRH